MVTIDGQSLILLDQDRESCLGRWGIGQDAPSIDQTVTYGRQHLYGSWHLTKLALIGW